MTMGRCFVLFFILLATIVMPGWSFSAMDQLLMTLPAINAEMAACIRDPSECRRQALCLHAGWFWEYERCTDESGSMEGIQRWPCVNAGLWWYNDECHREKHDDCSVLEQLDGVWRFTVEFDDGSEETYFYAIDIDRIDYAAWSADGKQYPAILMSGLSVRMTHHIPPPSWEDIDSIQHDYHLQDYSVAGGLNIFFNLNGDTKATGCAIYGAPGSCWPATGKMIGEISSAPSCPHISDRDRIYSNGMTP